MLHNRRHSSWRRSLLLLVAAVLVVTMAAGCGKSKDKSGAAALPGEGQGTTVASYDGGKVTDKQFDKYTALVGLTNPQVGMYLSIPQFKEQYLRQFVFSRMEYPQATDADKKDATTKADDFVKQMKDAIKTQPDLQSELDKTGLKFDEVHQLVEFLSASSAVIQRKLDELNKQVTDTERQEEFKKDPKQFDTATVRHVLIMTADPSTGEQKHTKEEALKIAKEAKAELDKSGDWNAVAKKYSEDTGTKDNGGLMENAKISSWVEGFKNAVYDQPIGKIGDPVESEYGYHVIVVEKREQPTYDKLAQADQDALTQAVGAGKLNTFMEAEQKKVNLKITLPQDPAADGGTGTNAGTNAGTDAGTDAGANGAGTNAATNDATGGTGADNTGADVNTETK